MQCNAMFILINVFNISPIKLCDCCNFSNHISLPWFLFFLSFSLSSDLNNKTNKSLKLKQKLTFSMFHQRFVDSIFSFLFLSLVLIFFSLFSSHKVFVFSHSKKKINLKNRKKTEC